MEIIKSIPYLAIQLCSFLRERYFELFFKWIDSRLLFGHLIKPKEEKKGGSFKYRFAMPNSHEYFYHSR